MEIQTEDLKYKVRIEISINKVMTLLSYEGELGTEPELRGLMDQYKEIVGDSKARVGVSTDFSVKDFGNGFSTMVTISLTCNQDQATIQQALGLASSMGRYYVKEYTKLAEQEFQSLQAGKGGPNFGR